MNRVIIIGAGLAGCEAARTLIQGGLTDLIVLEKNPEIIRDNSWKTFEEPVNKFNLAYTNRIEGINFRTCDIATSTLLTDTYKRIPCYVLDSRKIYADYERIIGNNVNTGEEVTNIRRIGKQYEITTNKKTYLTDLIIDASGHNSIVDNFIPTSFNQSALYTCYGKRFTNCNAEVLKSAYFDFDSPFKAAGCWVYPVNAKTVEIGFARFSNVRELEIPNHVKELNILLEKYKKLTPFNQVFTGDEELITTISGYTPLLPRLRIEREGIYFIGDAKGSIPYSGYGVENALESGRRAAQSILTGENYNYFVTPPSKGLAVLTHLWSCGEAKLRSTAPGIAQMDDQNTLKFFRGNIDLEFMIKSMKICKNRGINMLEFIPNNLAIRALLNLPPLPKHYKKFEEEIIQ